jgi:hypothetical protein
MNNLYIYLVKENAKFNGYDPDRIFKSNKKGKKFYYLTPDDKKVHFGAKGMNDFLLYLINDGVDVARERRRLYHLRHKNDPTDKYSAGELARNILW